MTIIDQPTGYFAYGSGDELVYLVSDTNYTEERFRYIAQIFIDGTERARLKALPNASNNGIFDIANIVRDYVVPQVAFNTTNFVNDELGSRSVYVKFGYESAPDPAVEPTEVLNLATSSVIEVTSGIYQNYEDDYGVLMVEQFDTDSINNLSPFISHYNEEHRVVKVSDNDWGTMSVFRSGTSGTTVGLAIQFYDANGTLIPDGANQYGLLTHVSNAITGNGIAHVGVYPQNLRNNTTAAITAGSVNPDDYAGWASYRIAWTSTLSHTLMEFQKEEGCADRVRFAWWNSYGAWDFINCYGRYKETRNVERKTYRTYGGNAFNASSAYVHTAEEGIASGGKSKIRKSRRVNTNWLPEWMNGVVQDLFVSPVVYVQEGDKWLPVKLIASSIQINRREVDKVAEYEFEYEYINPVKSIG